MPEPTGPALDGDARYRSPGRPGAKSGEALAERIEAEIVEQGWPVGTLLGTEPELLERYGVSRPVLREAIRLLEHHMVAEMRRGAGGGLRVRVPDPSMVTNAAALYLDFKRVRVRQLYSARILLEARCVELAVERLTEEGIAELRAVVERLRTSDAVQVVELSHELERLIADLSGDPVLALFVKVLLQLAHQHAVPIEERRARRRSVYALRDHQVGIAEAIISGDAPTARLRLVRYLEGAAASARRRLLAAAAAGAEPASVRADGIT